MHVSRDLAEYVANLLHYEYVKLCQVQRASEITPEYSDFLLRLAELSQQFMRLAERCR